MNKAVTGGIDLMPPAFSRGLSVWSSQDGLSGQATYDGAPNAALVAGDADFGDCLEIFKISSVQKLRYTGLTSITPGCYLRISARVKLVGGNRPSVRIAAYAQNAGGAAVSVPTTGEAVFLETYGEVYEVSAIVGQGARGGVDLVWSQAAVAALTPFFPRPILCSSSTAPATRGRGYFSPGRGMYLHIHPLEISSTDTCEC